MLAYRRGYQHHVLVFVRITAGLLSKEQKVKRWQGYASFAGLTPTPANFSTDALSIAMLWLPKAKQDDRKFNKESWAKHQEVYQRGTILEQAYNKGQSHECGKCLGTEKKGPPPSLKATSQVLFSPFHKKHFHTANNGQLLYY